VIVIDELAALTAYADRALKDRIKQALALILTQGRAVGFHVLALVQDPRKEVVPFRDLFTTRIGLRMNEAEQVDLTLGDGARERGAWCDRISAHTPGVAYVVLDEHPAPARVRMSYLDDADIAATAATYGRAGVINGTTVPAQRSTATDLDVNTPGWTVNR
jgi:S-DNA-T family DNA segregation ATPase FtsK/SpoIIIE